MASGKGNSVWTSKPKDVGRSCVLGQHLQGLCPKARGPSEGHEQCREMSWLPFLSIGLEAQVTVP